MRRILLAAGLGIAGALGTTTIANADIADIRNLSADETAQGTAEAVEVSGAIRCTTTIEYGIVAAVAQPDVSDSFQFEPDGEPMGPESPIQGVAAFGPNAGNEANSPCTTNLQGYEIVVQRNRDSGTFSDTGANAPPDNMEVIVTAGTSAENGDRGPGPFIGDWGLVANAVDFTRTDP